MRQIVLDTETTGLEPSQGHRIIEIGCVELINRKRTGNNYHLYLQPDREIDPGAQEVHGISNEFLRDKPRFTDIVDDLMAYLRGAELVIHNAPFDVGFLDAELERAECGTRPVGRICQVLDTLVMARRMHPGQKNSLDALCKRYHIDNSQREKHGALLDAEILSDVYLAMTGGQVSLSLGGASSNTGAATEESIRRIEAGRFELLVVPASEEERAAHARRLEQIDAASDGHTVWRQWDAYRETAN